MTGTLLAMSLLKNGAAVPIVNLRSPNPYVESIFSSSAHGHQLVPRTGGGTAALCTPSAAAGASSFGMSGVNAHALLANWSGSGGSKLGAASLIRQGLWQRGGCWPCPLLHPLLRSSTTGTAATQILLDVRSSKNAWLNDHFVFGRALLPGAAMAETLWASAKALEAAAPALNNLIILAPASLEDSNMQLLCSLRMLDGTVSLENLQGQHFCLSSVVRSLEGEAMTTKLNSTGTSVMAALIPSQQLTIQSGHKIAALAPPPPGSFYAHPAAMDSSIHLAPVPPAHPLAEVVTRVPTAVGGVSLDAGVSTRPSGWACVRPLGTDANTGAALNDVRATGAWSLINLEAKPMAQQKSTSASGDPVSNWQYEVTALANEPCADGGMPVGSMQLEFAAGGQSWLISDDAISAPLELVQQVWQNLPGSFLYLFFSTGTT